MTNTPNNRYTFNVNAIAVRDRARLESALSAMNPSTLFVLDGIGLAQSLKQYVKKDGIIIHRFYQVEEGEYWQKKSPEDCIREIKTRAGNAVGEFYHAVNNEPSHDATRTIRQLLQWNIRLMDLARKDNIRLAVGEFAAAKTIHKSDIDAGIWDDFIRALDRHKDFHILTTHEYTAVTLPFTFMMPASPQDWTNPEFFKFDRYPKDPLPIQRKLDSQLPDYWHLGRTLWLLIRAKEIGVTPPKFIVTEGLWDKMDDINTPKKELGNRGIYDVLTNMFMTDIRGVMSYVNIYPQLYYKGMTFDEAAIQQLAWVDKIVYPEQCLGICLFAWNQGWERQLHDYSHPSIDGLIEKLKQYARGEIRSMWNREENSKTLKVWSSGAYRVNIREEASASSKIIGKVEPTAQRYDITLNAVNNSGGTWHKVNNGYVRSDLVHVVGHSEPDLNHAKKVYQSAASGDTDWVLETLYPTGGQLFVYDDASFSGNKIGVVKPSILAYTNSFRFGGGDWVYVTFLETNGNNSIPRCGWVNKVSYSLTIPTTKEDVVSYKYDPSNQRQKSIAEIIKGIIGLE